ncbi:molybdopterin molybdotransferase MoeA [Rhodobacteraceae bacterium NNCM2]|nr:molybdopterin molybdotransferase MoeA [Coraliihabitans acroporae]
MLSVSEALSKVLALAPVMGAETVPLEQATGRVLAADAIARRDQPPFAASAMDGYAVRNGEATVGAELTVVDEAAAGHRAKAVLEPGTAIRIFTGAPVPEGADAILIQENADRSGDRIRVVEQPKPGEFVRPSGGDFNAGFRIPAPRRLTSRDLALLAAMNIAEVAVAKRPVVALIPTGDELVRPGDDPGPDQIIASNNYGLAAMSTMVGASPLQCPIARDTPESLRASFAAAEGANIIVSLGGASVGDHDLVANVMSDAGLALDFYKIAMRPGKPLMAGKLGGAMMIGLPGNPVSAMVCGEVFLRPAIDKALGLPAGPRPTETAVLAHAIPENGPREHYMRALVTPAPSSLPVVEVFENQDSSRLATLARANALVVRKPYAEKLPQGEQVEFIRLD